MPEVCAHDEDESFRGFAVVLDSSLFQWHIGGASLWACREHEELGHKLSDTPPGLLGTHGYTLCRLRIIFSDVFSISDFD